MGKLILKGALSGATCSAFPVTNWMYKCKCCVNVKDDTWLTPSFTAVRLYLWEISCSMYSVFPYSSFWANLADTAIGFTGCVSLGWSTSGSVIQDHSDHGTSKELMNPPYHDLSDLRSMTLICIIPKECTHKVHHSNGFSDIETMLGTMLLVGFCNKVFTFYSTGERQDLRIWPRHDCWEMQGGPQLAGGESRSK